jgi:hypothetical protein
MNGRTRILLGACTVVFLGVLAAVLAVLFTRDAVLELRVRDAVSSRWVWEVTMKLQDREARGFYQSDSGLRLFRFTHLKPGASTLEISAPSYQALTIPVTLRRGINRLPGPVDLVGKEIPGLGGFLMFENLDGNDVVVQLRPVQKSGAAILNHPCLDLWVGCRVFVQMANGVPARDDAATGWTRGAELFRGQIPWTWDPAPEATFRYSARMAGARMKGDPSGLRIIDYLVVVPDPLRITKGELDALMTRLESGDPAAMSAALDAEGDRLRYFTDTSWNVKVTPE